MTPHINNGKDQPKPTTTATELEMDSVVSGIQEFSLDVVNNGGSSSFSCTEAAMSNFFTPDASFTNAMGDHFPGRSAIVGAWTTWFDSLEAANDRAVDRVFDGRNLRAQWARSGSVSMKGGKRFEYYDTLNAQFVKQQEHEEANGSNKLRILKLTSKLHRWQQV